MSRPDADWILLRSKVLFFRAAVNFDTVRSNRDKNACYHLTGTLIYPQHLSGGRVMAQQAVGYIRVSTEGQVVDGVSLDAQRAKIEAWALLNDYELVAVHVDAGISGKSALNRPGLQAALADCRSGSALVVYSLSRLARSTKDTIEISDRLAKSGADLVSLSEKIDTTSAAGKMIFRLLAVMAEFERDQISERTTAALQFKKSRGEKTGGQVPFGHDLADDGVRLLDNAEEQSVIQQARELKASGLSLRKIAAELQRRGFVSRAGTMFQPGQIQRMVA